MDDAAVNEESAVAVHEIGAGQSLAGVLHLRVAERQPYLLHLILPEEAVDNLNVRAQEGHILQPLLQGFGGTCPHTCALDVNTNEIHVREESCQSYGIFSLAASQFQYDGV